VNEHDKHITIINELRSHLLGFADSHPAPVALANMTGLLIYQLVDLYIEHLENKQYEEILTYWSVQQADREAWNFIRWTLESFADPDTIKSLLND
jgi:hypothetical protein